jgi:hypothetical protein
MGYHGKHMISPKEVTVDLKSSLLSNSPNIGHNLQGRLVCLQHRLKTIQSFGLHLPPLLHQDNLPADLEDPHSSLTMKRHLRAA